MFKQLVSGILIVALLSSCATNGTPAIEPPVEEAKEQHYRVIPAEPEENAANYLRELRRNEENQLLPIGPELLLRSAIYKDNFSVEYYISGYFDSDGSFTSDSPAYDTLLVRSNGKVYPLVPLAYNCYIKSLTCSEDFNGNILHVWALTDYPIALYEYTYDSEADSFMENTKDYEQEGKLTFADFFF
jgi:hypothetical protein